jgi:hypothetical protein
MLTCANADRPVRTVVPGDGPCWIIRDQSVTTPWGETPPRDRLASSTNPDARVVRMRILHGSLRRRVSAKAERNLYQRTASAGLVAIVVVPALVRSASSHHPPVDNVALVDR